MNMARTLVTEIQPENVTTVGETDPYEDDDDITTIPTMLMEGDFHDRRVKGLQVGSYLIWFQPSEFATLAEFFGEDE